MKSSSKKLFEIVSFYKFHQFTRVSLVQIQKNLLSRGEHYCIRGLILLSREGINATISGESQNIDQYLKELETLTGIDCFFYKRSPTNVWGFKKLRIKIKREIISMGKMFRISFLKNLYTQCCSWFSKDGLWSLESEEWELMMQEENINILDIRNDYEVEVGQFKKATILDMQEFKQFPEKLKESRLEKDKKTLIYCTGGIRCEKALTEMHKQGFKEVYQLKGGILNYLKDFPNKSFEGECFVFDRRVAVDQNRKNSAQYSLCPHCGQAADQSIQCVHCKKEAKVCRKCLEKKQPHLMTCTKNCAYHARLGHQCRTSK